MGGRGSGRSGGKPTSEACGSFVLTTTTFARVGLRMKGTISATWSDHGEPFPVSIAIDTIGTTYCYLELAHASRNRWNSTQRYQVRLETSPQPFGGVRWWFVCPQSERRCTKLFLPRGGHRFWSRKAYDLGYACQREDRQYQAQRQAIKTYKALGGDAEGNWRGGAPEKPKWMRWHTYDRLAARLDHYNDAFDGHWMTSIARLLARAPMKSR